MQSRPVVLLAVAVVSLVAPELEAARKKKTPCSTTYETCPSGGCPGGDAPLNKLKNRVDPAQDSADLEDWKVDQIVDLDEATPDTWPRGNIRTTLEEIGEGTPVRLKGWLINAHDAKTPETCNCFFGELIHRDFHLNITGRKTGHEDDSIVLEITPHVRLAGWTIQKLEKLTDPDPTYVRATGWLLLDTMHLKGATGRATAWEVHPVTAFEVCTTTKAKCDQNQDWEPLETFTPTP